jgi:hypothetical protein
MSFPARGSQNTSTVAPSLGVFSQALQTSTHQGTFSPQEKRSLVLASALSFALPVLIALLLSSSPTLTHFSSPLRSFSGSDLASVPQTPSNDDEVMHTRVATIGDGNTPVLTVPESTVQRVAAPANAASPATLGVSVVTNASQDSVVFPQGDNEVFVAYPSLRSTTRLYLVIANNPDNAVIYVKSKEAGVGFTLATTTALTQNVTVEWYEIDE